MKKEELTTIKGEVHFEDIISRNVLERVDTHVLRGTLPNVLNKEVFRADNSSPITVTDFQKGASGQRLYILGDGNTTIEHGTFIFTNTGANKLLETNKVYRFTFFKVGTSHKWVEDA